MRLVWHTALENTSEVKILGDELKPQTTRLIVKICYVYQLNPAAILDAILNSQKNSRRTSEHF